MLPRLLPGPWRAADEVPSRARRARRCRGVDRQEPAQPAGGQPRPPWAPADERAAGAGPGPPRAGPGGRPVSPQPPPPEDTPPPVRGARPSAGTVDAGVFAAAVSQVAVAAGRDDTL